MGSVIVSLDFGVKISVGLLGVLVLLDVGEVFAEGPHVIVGLVDERPRVFKQSVGV
jgi:hypothetical protein